MGASMIFLTAFAAVLAPVAPDSAVALVAAAEPCRLQKFDATSQSNDGQRQSESAQSELYLLCGSSATRLGKFEAYRSAYSASLGRYLVVGRADGRERLLLIKPADNGPAIIEDVAVDVAVASGRSKSEGLAEGALDITDFAVSGAISVVPASSLKAHDPGNATTKFVLRNGTIGVLKGD